MGNNGHDILPPITSVLQNNPAVELLGNLLNEAKAGRINAVAIVVGAGPGQVGSYHLNTRNLDMLAGLTILEHQIMDAIKGSQQKTSSIVRAVPAG